MIDDGQAERFGGRLRSPEDGSSVREDARKTVEAALETAIPLAGRAATVLARQLAPSNKDQQIASWHDQATQKINEDSDRLDAHDERLGKVESKQATVVASVNHLVVAQSGLRATELAHDHLDGELDGYRTLLNEGRPKTALERLNGQFGTTEKLASFPPRVVARSKALMAVCHHHLGDVPHAVRLFEEAYELDPKNPKIIANRVYGLLLAERVGDALTFSRAALAQDPANSHLAARFVDAHRMAACPGDPRSELPENIRQVETVQFALVQWLRHRNDEAWRAAAAHAAIRFPANREIRLFAAEAILEAEIPGDGVRSRPLSAASAAEISGAGETLQDGWRHVIASERAVSEQDLSTLHNALVAFLLVEEIDKARALVMEAKDHFGSYGPVIRLGVLVATRASNEELVDELIELDSGAALDVKIEGALRREQWEDALQLIDDGRGTAEEKGPQSLDALRGCVSVLTGNANHYEAGFRDMLEAGEADPHALLCISRFSAKADVISVSDEALELACQTLADDAPYELRLQIASEAYGRGKAGHLISLLEGFAEPSRDVVERNWLARAYANSLPTEAGKRFFAAVLHGKTGTFISHLHEGAFHYNRGEPRTAAACFRRALQLRPGDIGTVLNLWSSLKRAGRDADAARTIERFDLNTAEGSPEQRLGLAQLLHDVGRPEALEFAYATMIRHRNDAKASLLYVGLLIAKPNRRSTPELDDVAEVGPETEVTIRDTRGQTDRFIISDADDPSDRHRSSSHPIVVAALGKRPEDTFKIRSGLKDFEWRSVAVKSKFIALLHDILATFEHRFPGHRGFYSIAIENDDITPILDQTKALAAHLERLAQEYERKRLPLAVASAIGGGGSTLGFAGSLAQAGTALRTSIGFDAEQDIEARVAEAVDRERGVVLDGYTAWFLGTTGLLSFAHRLFGQLLISQTALDEIDQLLEPLQPDGEPHRAMYWANGSAHLVETSPDVVAAQQRHRQDVRRDIVPLCSIVGTEVSNRLTRDLINLIDTVPVAFGPLIVGERERIPLFSADLHLRAWHAQLFQGSAFGMKGFLRVAAKRGMMNPSEIGRVVLDMARHNHNHIPLNGPALVEIFDADMSSDLDDVRLVSKYLGGPDAEYESHVAVAATFFELMTRRASLIPDFRRHFGPGVRGERAAGIILRNLTRLPNEHPSDTIVDVIRRCGRPNWLVRYAHDWSLGHFMLPSRSA